MPKRRQEQREPTHDWQQIQRCVQEKNHRFTTSDDQQQIGQ